MLREVNEIKGIENKIHDFTSKDISDDLIECFGSLGKLCEQLHLPIQSGSNSILKKMNRKYTREDYLNIVGKIRKTNPDIVITTDLIVGFPGETEEDFQDTLDLVKEVKYDSAFTFLYSIREGTQAANMENQIPDNVKHERFQRLMDELNKIGLDKNEKYLGKNVEVLVEEVSKNDEKTLNGRTRNGKLVHFPGTKDLIGSIIKVKIERVKTFTMEGIVV